MCTIIHKHKYIKDKASDVNADIPPLTSLASLVTETVFGKEGKYWGKIIISATFF